MRVTTKIKHKCDSCFDTGYIEYPVYINNELDGYDETICECQLVDEGDIGDEDYDNWKNNN